MHLIIFRTVAPHFLHIVLLLLLLSSSSSSPLMMMMMTGIELSLGGSSPYTSTNKTNKNKYT